MFIVPAWGDWERFCNCSLSWIVWFYSHGDRTGSHTRDGVDPETTQWNTRYDWSVLWDDITRCPCQSEKSLYALCSCPSLLSQDWILYRELLGLLFEHKLSTGDERAEDILTVIKKMKHTSHVDNSYFYPVLAHHAEKGDVDGELSVWRCVLVTSWCVWLLSGCLDTLDLINVAARNKFDFYS